MACDKREMAIHSSAIVYYDDSCALCRAFKGKVEAGGNGKFVFRPLTKDFRDKLILIDSDNTVYEGVQGIGRIACEFGLFLKAMGWLINIFPFSVLSRLIYRLISVNRFFLSNIINIRAK